MFGKNINGVFLELFPTTKKPFAWEIFQTKTESKDTYQSKELNKLKEEYDELLNDEPFLNKLKLLAEKEIEIIQHHCLQNLQVIIGEFIQQRNGGIVSYIIARAPFYVNKQDRREMRVYIDKLEEGKTIEELRNDEAFMNMAKIKMKKAMLEEMENIIILNTIKKFPEEMEPEFKNSNNYI